MEMIGCFSNRAPSSKASTTCRKSWNDAHSTWIELAPRERIPSTLTTSTICFLTGSTDTSRDPLSEPVWCRFRGEHGRDAIEP